MKAGLSFQPSCGLARRPGFAALTLTLALASPFARQAAAQTLARPRWAGSGMTAERWWPQAVLCEVTPDSLPAALPAGNSSTLHRLSARIEDLQTLGVDAVLLRGLETAGQPPSAARSAPAAVVAIDPRYGSLDDFDDLLANAVRHGVRVLVELSITPNGTSLTNDARFWLNRGVTGLALSGASDPAQIRLLRGVLRGYVGERVLIAGSPSTNPAPPATPPADARAETRPAARPAIRPAIHPDEPDLLRLSLPPISSGPAAMREALERARNLASSGRAPVPLLSAEDAPADPASARILATALLGSGGAVLLRADDLDLEHAAAAPQNTVFSWYSKWSGLHRGNPAMRSGQDTLLDHDADGALVWVRQARGSAAPIVVISNVTAKPIRFSLVDDIARLRLRGSFLRTVARSDRGMGAMPLRDVVLPPYAVYAGELSR